MNLKKIRVIIGREYAIRVKKKSFLLTTFLTPILMGVLMVLPTILMLYGSKGEEGQKVAVLDNSGIVMPYLDSDDKVAFLDYSGYDQEQLKSEMDSLGLKGYVVISDLDTAASVSVGAYSYKPLSGTVTGRLEDAVETAVEDYRIKSFNIEGLKDILSSVSYNASITSYTIGDDGSEKVTITEIYRIISMIFSILIYIFVYSFGAMVMSAVIDEKKSRVVEVMVSSVRSTELMVGKILGIASVALTQFILWIVLTLAIFFGVQAVIGVGQVASDPEMATEMMAMAGAQAEDMTSVMQNSELGAVMSTISQIDFVSVIGSFLVFFVFGYLLYASLFAAIGSAVDDEADTQQLLIPITIPILAGFFISLATAENPESPLLIWASYIPFTSPICMMSRIVAGIPGWEIILSLVILVLTTILMMYFSAKIYKVGILMFGKKTTFKDLWKWLRYK